MVVFSLGAVQTDSSSSSSHNIPSATTSTTTTNNEKIPDFDSFIVDNFEHETINSSGKADNHHSSSTKGVIRQKKWLEWLLVLFGSLYLLFYVGTEIAAGGFINAFGQTIAKFSKDEST